MACLPHFCSVSTVQLPHDSLLQQSTVIIGAELEKPGDVQVMVGGMSSVHPGNFVLYMISLPLLPYPFFFREGGVSLAFSGLRSGCRVSVEG